MPTLTPKAHYDGERIQLDEPFDLPEDSQLMMTILAPEPLDERAEWLQFSAAGLARAYSDDEPEYEFDAKRARIKFESEL